ncbi:hypothetical protein MKEN_01323800 [Mycena kentingensis (nom. inval.)]|nr:hypothetical protein MKEN_01323800 [Mycena kentingensis (nom. inval.)]
MNLPPALTTQGFKTLPVLVKRSAVEAYKRDAHPLTVERAFKYAVDNPDSKRLVGLLPICFMHLDPAAMPSSDDVERAHTPALHAMSRGTSSLILLFKIGAYEVSNAGKLVLHHLWPRIFPWYLFVLEHWTLLHAEDDDHPESEATFHASLLDFARIRAADDAAVKTVLGTQGFIEQLVRIWEFYSTIDDTSMALDILFDLKFFTLEVEVEQRPIFERVVAGAGGSVRTLAGILNSAMTSIIDAAEMTCDDPNTEVRTTERFVSGLYPLLRMILGSEDDKRRSPRGQPWLGPPFGAITHEMLPMEGIRLIMRCAEAHTPGCVLPLTDADAVTMALYPLELCFLFLLRVLSWTHGDGCGWMDETLQYELLRIVLLTARMLDTLGELPDADEEFVRKGLRERLQSVLDRLIPVELVSRSAVEILTNELATLDKESESPETAYQHSAVFKASPVGTAWFQLKTLAKERADILQALQDSPGKKSCDNLECGKILLKGKTRRCSECQSVYYCCKACQRVDWHRSNGHREFCAFYKVGELCLTSHIRNSLYYSQRMYLRALVNHDYHQRWTDIHVQQIQYLLKHATQLQLASAAERPALITTFRYTRHPMLVYVSSTVDTTPQHNSAAQILEKGGVEWADLVARAASSRQGSFELHVVETYEGVKPRYVVIPLRREHGLGRRVCDGLRSITGRILEQNTPDDVEAIREEVEKLRLEVADPDMEIH